MYLQADATHGLKSVISNLKNKISSGDDDIPTSFIQFCFEEKCGVLSHIINNSSHYGIFLKN